MTNKPIVVAAVLAGTIAAIAGLAAQAQPNRAALAERIGITTNTLDLLEARNGLTDPAIANMPFQVIQQLLLEMEYPDLAQRRAAFRRLQSVNEDGQIPVRALENAVEQLRTLRSVSRAAQAQLPTGPLIDIRAIAPRIRGGFPAVTTAAPAGGAGGRGRFRGLAGALNPARWTWLGPGNVGGRTRALAIDPANPKSIWAGSVGGGVWHSADQGVSFSPVDDLMANLVVSSLVIDPTNSQHVCAGTGEGFYNGDALQGAGIFCTFDGTHWSVLTATLTPDYQYVNRLAINATGKIMLAATRAGLFRSDDAGWTNWSPRWTGEFSDVVFHPTDASLAVAGGLKNGQAYYTTDGGLNWHPVTHPGVWNDRVELTYSRKNPAIVYASVNNGTGEIWRSVDGGQTYSRRRGVDAAGKAVPFLGKQGWYGNAIWAGDSTNSNLVIVGGIDLWKSTDGGDTLVDISSWWDDRSVHSDQHVIVADAKYDGTTNRAVYFGNDGGIFRADDVSKAGNNSQPPCISGWTRLDNDYGVTQFYHATGGRSGLILGGTQDNGTILSTGSQKWGSMYGGDGGWTAIDPADEHVLYGEYVDLNVHRSLDGGKTTEFISGRYPVRVNGEWVWKWKPVPFTIADAQTGNALFIAPFVLDPTNRDRMLAGGYQLWRTNDARAPLTTTSGPRWESIKPATTTAISAMAVDAADARVVWVGHVNGDLYRSDNATDAAPGWTKLDDASTPLPNRYVTRIAIDPHTSKTVYATFGGFSQGNIWKSQDNGVTWHDISNGLPAAPIRAVTVHPAQSGHLYVGTELGVFESTDDGATWSATNQGPTNCSVEDLFWHGTTLIAVTHGRGLFAIPQP